MHNLATVFSFEFLRTIKKSGFWLSVLSFPVIFGLIFGVSYLSGRSAETAEERANQEKFSLVILDESQLLLPEVVMAVGAGTVVNKEAGIKAVQNNTVDAFIYYPTDPTKEKVEVFAKDAGLTKNSKYTTTAKELLRASVSASIGSAEKIAIVQGNTETDLTTYIDGEEQKGFERVIAPGAFVILFFIVVSLLGGQMLASTTEEKENRVIEMILTTVDATTLIVGKIFALILLGVVQILIVTVPVVIAAVFFGDQLNLPNLNLGELVLDPMQLMIGAALFVFGFLLFTGMLVAIGAAMPTAQEANSFFGVAIFGMMAPLYAAAAIVTDPGQLIVKVFSFFPLSAPITLMLRNAAGNLGYGEAAIGIVILLVSSVIAIYAAVQAFRQGTLEYSRKLSLREIFAR